MKTMVIAILSAIACASIILFVLLLLADTMTEGTIYQIEWKQTAHIVQKGETLWDIAEKYCPNGVDIRVWIHEVEKINSIEEYIYAGDEIVVLEAK